MCILPLVIKRRTILVANHSMNINQDILEFLVSLFKRLYQQKNKVFFTVLQKIFRIDNPFTYFHFNIIAVV